MSKNKGYYKLLFVASSVVLLMHGHQYLSSNSIKLTSGYMYATDALLVVIFEIFIVITSSVQLFRFRKL